MQQKTLVVAAGSAGTGKTMLSLYHAAKQLLEGRTKKIVLIRAYQPLAGRSIGFLPGELEDKLLPYYAQMLNYLEDFLTIPRVDVWRKSGAIEICSLETIRGRSWDYGTIIVDECFEGSTEVLTAGGFKRFDQLNTSEAIATYSKDGKVVFEVPTRLVQKEHKGEMIEHFKDQFSMKATAGHNAVFKIKDQIELRRFDSDLIWNAKIPVSGMLDGQYNKSPFVVIDCALQADGSYSTTTSTNGTDFHYWEIQFSKENKIDRFRSALNASGIKYSEYAKNKEGKIKFYLSDYSPKFLSGNLKEKNFDLNKILEYAFGEQVIEEIQYWDGHIRGTGYTYCSTNKHNIEAIQALAHIMGYSANFGVQVDTRKMFKKPPKPNYRLNVSKLIYKTTQRMQTKTEHFEGIVYCATVSTGMILVRQNGKVFVTGNCQNLYSEEIQALTTRIGEGSQMILLGDNSGTQSDIKNKKDGLSYLLGIIDKYKIEDAAYTKLGYEDILRSGITREFVIAYDKELQEEKEIISKPQQRNRHNRYNKTVQQVNVKGEI